jgi:hypothetical protein
MLEHPAEPGDAKIADIAREINFRKLHRMGPDEQLCSYQIRM